MNPDFKLFLNELENTIQTFVQSPNERGEIDIRLEEMDLKIILIRKRWLYPLRNCPTPEIIPNQINIANATPKIEEIIKTHFSSKWDHYSREYKLSNGKSFEIRFFKSENMMENTIEKEEKKYAKIDHPRCGIKYLCTVI